MTDISRLASENGLSPDHNIDQLVTLDLTPQAEGLNPSQVRGAFAALCAELEPIYVQMAALIRENDQLRRQAVRTHGTTPGEEEHDYAVALLTQAQELADSLIADATDQARDLVWAARAHQREIIKNASTVVASPGQTSAGGSGEVDSDGAAVVQTLAKLAQTQFLSVLDALTEQVNRLGEATTSDAQLSEGGGPRKEISLPPPSRRASRQAS